jgi:hypothetical protein
MKSRLLAKVEYTFHSVAHGWKVYCDVVRDWEFREWDDMVNDLSAGVDPIVSYLDQTYPGPFSIDETTPCSIVTKGASS